MNDVFRSGSMGESERRGWIGMELVVVEVLTGLAIDLYFHI